MDVCKVFLRVYFVSLLQTAQCGAIHFKILLAQYRHIRFRNGKPLKHVGGHPLLDGLPETGRGGIEGIIEIEKEGRKPHQQIITPPKRGNLAKVVLYLAAVQMPPACGTRIYFSSRLKKSTVF